MAEIHILDERAATIVGINIGGTNTTVVGGLDDGTIVARWSAPTVVDDGELLVDAVVAAAHAVAPAARCAGVAVGGPLNVRDGIVTEAVHLPGLHGMPLRDRLSDALDLPVGLHHDAAACALAEWRWGPDAGADGLAYLTCGTGFGTGLVLNGRVRYAPDGRTPEIGHIRYRDDGPPIFGKPGCYEGYASANALALLLLYRDPAMPAATPAQVVNEIREHNAAAVWALRSNERAVGSACAMLADLLVLDVIVLGTLATYLGPPWVEAVRKVFREEALEVNAEACVLRSAMPDVQDRSALAAALDPIVPPAPPARARNGMRRWRRT
jgi:glucokinase